jgi:hypothetical protein
MPRENGQCFKHIYFCNKAPQVPVPLAWHCLSQVKFMIFCDALFILKIDKHTPSTITNFTSLVNACSMHWLVKFIVVNGLRLSVLIWCTAMGWIVQKLPNSFVLSVLHDSLNILLGSQKITVSCKYKSLIPVKFVAVCSVLYHKLLFVQYYITNFCLQRYIKT